MHQLTGPWQGIGTRLSADKIDARLRAMPLVPTLTRLFLLAQIVDHATVTVPLLHVRQRALANVLLSPTEFDKFDRLPRTSSTPLVTSSQAVLALARRRIFLFDESQPRGEAGDLVPTAQLMKLLFSVNEQVDVSPYPGPDRLLNVVNELRYRLFFSRAQPRYWYEVAHGIFFDHLASTALGTDILSRFEAKTGVSLLDCWYYGAIIGMYLFALPEQWMKAYGVSEDEMNEPQHLRRIYRGVLDNAEFSELPVHSVTDTNATLPSWVRLISFETEDELRARASFDEGGSQAAWSFTAFYQCPVSTVRPGPGRVSRPRYMQERSAPEGLFWLLSDHADLVEAEQRALHKLYGDAFGDFALDQLRQAALEDESVWDDHQLDETWPRKDRDDVCDCMLLSDNLALGAAFEFKKHFFKKDLRATGVVEKATADVQALIDGKLVTGLNQIADSLRRMRRTPPNPLFPTVSVLPVVVLGSMYPASTDLAELVANDPELAPDLATLCQAESFGGRGLVVMDAFEFVALLALARSEHASILAMFQEWQRHSASMTALNWMAEVARFPSLSTDVWYQSLERRHGHRIPTFASK